MVEKYVQNSGVFYYLFIYFKVIELNTSVPLQKQGQVTWDSVIRGEFQGTKVVYLAASHVTHCHINTVPLCQPMAFMNDLLI